MQATPSIPVLEQTPRASEFWLLVPVALVAAAAVWWPVSPTGIEEAVAPQPVEMALPAIGGDISVPNASQVRFKDDAFEEPAPTF
ncbi:MAG: hypothetical protein ABIR94_23320 [Rubrivivax sp.]